MGEYYYKSKQKQRLKMGYCCSVYNITKALNQNPINWSHVFTISRGHRLLHDARLLPKPEQSEDYAKELWITMLTVEYLFLF